MHSFDPTSTIFPRDSAVEVMVASRLTIPQGDRPSIVFASKAYERKALLKRQRVLVVKSQVNIIVS
jgi:hypothetical protein